jgi:predicted GH43/DUF377 family glycosyl hydrolase
MFSDFLKDKSGAQRRIRTTDTRIFNPEVNKCDQKLNLHRLVKPAFEDQRLTSDLSNSVAEQLRSLAQDVERIGSGWHCDAEVVFLQKMEVAHKINVLADKLEG